MYTETNTPNDVVGAHTRLAPCECCRHFCFYYLHIPLSMSALLASDPSTQPLPFLAGCPLPRSRQGS
ncbi:hypothetical protein BLNAU_16359 [Blattamonas nauphoetae]|uniref:Uncharacterized protein n=1 Tax=Blattamonas nauphoetae TaxID=2049346 RepID=A0ABQ9X9X3_9EUKA|nr:hypothetical protein BLNAU_16359 [Blattamonas nauphoetae]